MTGLLLRHIRDRNRIYILAAEVITSTSGAPYGSHHHMVDLGYRQVVVDLKPTSIRDALKTSICWVVSSVSIVVTVIVLII